MNYQRLFWITQGIGWITAIVFALLLFASCSYLKPDPRPWTKEEKQAAVYFTVGHLLDAYTTEKFLENPRLYEMNPILGKRPNDKEIVIYFAVTEIGALTIAHFWPWLRKPLLFSYGTTGFYWARHNYRLMQKYDR